MKNTFNVSIILEGILKIKYYEVKSSHMCRTDTDNGTTTITLGTISTTTATSAAADYGNDNDDKNGNNGNNNNDANNNDNSKGTDLKRSLYRFQGSLITASPCNQPTI